MQGGFSYIIPKREGQQSNSKGVRGQQWSTTSNAQWGEEQVIREGRCLRDVNIQTTQHTFFSCAARPRKDCDVRHMFVQFLRMGHVSVNRTRRPGTTTFLASCVLLHVCITGCILTKCTRACTPLLSMFHNFRGIRGGFSLFVRQRATPNRNTRQGFLPPSLREHCSRHNVQGAVRLFSDVSQECRRERSAPRQIVGYVISRYLSAVTVQGRVSLSTPSF